jgi:hypothetical protein
MEPPTAAAATADIITAHRRVTTIRLTGTVFFQPSCACKYSELSIIRDSIQISPKLSKNR